jgi:hypothetical protein
MDSVFVVMRLRVPDRFLDLGIMPMVEPGDKSWGAWRH